MEREVARLKRRCDERGPGVVRHGLAALPDLGWVLGDAMLVASELVSNAVLQLDVYQSRPAHRRSLPR